MNIQTYRAKKLDSDEWVEGYLLPPYKGKIYLSTTWDYEDTGYTPNFIEIDPSTMAIHFSNMVDKNGKKIFASLGEDGVGGDKCNIEYKPRYDIETTEKFGSLLRYDDEESRFVFEVLDDDRHILTYWNKTIVNIEIIGIHKG